MHGKRALAHADELSAAWRRKWARPPAPLLAAGPGTGVQGPVRTSARWLGCDAVAAVLYGWVGAVGSTLI